MLNILGKRLGAPWTYAALERGMEAYPGAPTISDLLHVYHYPVINSNTPLIGVTGLGERERATVAALNAAFAHIAAPVRCLPLAVGDVQQFVKIIEAFKLSGAVLAAEHRRAVVGMNPVLSEPAARLQSADLLLPRENRWHGHDTQVSATVKSLEETLKERNPGRSLSGQMVLIVGNNPMAYALGRELKQRGCAVILTSHERKASHAAAQELGCRAIQFEALYTTLHDVLVVCEEYKEPGAVPRRELAVHPGYFHSGMTLLHLTSGMHKSALMLAAEARGSTVVKPHRLWLDQVELQAQRLTGQEIPRKVLEDAAPWLLEEE
jgi:3-dehydroquinate dehydratase/shikimate dehydrogenase